MKNLYIKLYNSAIFSVYIKCYNNIIVDIQQIKKKSFGMILAMLLLLKSIFLAI